MSIKKNLIYLIKNSLNLKINISHKFINKNSFNLLRKLCVKRSLLLKLFFSKYRIDKKIENKINSLNLSIGDSS